MGLTRDFFSQPKTFLETYLVDNVAIQRKVTSGTLFATLNANRKVYFRMKKVSTSTFGIGENKVELLLGATAGDIPSEGNDFAVASYWCPFLSGNAGVGYVDIPRSSPAHKFVLTAAMQGCWFVVTDTVPPDPGMMRVHHHQHPDDAILWRRMQPPTHAPGLQDPPADSAAPLKSMPYSCLWQGDGGGLHRGQRLQRPAPRGRGVALPLPGPAPDARRARVRAPA